MSKHYLQRIAQLFQQHYTYMYISFAEQQSTWLLAQLIVWLVY